MKKITEILNTRRIILDGGTGTLLQKAGLPAGTPPEVWNLKHPEKIKELHLSYYESGSDIVATNTFGVNANKYANYSEYIKSAISIAKSARDEYVSKHGGEKYVAFDIGPSGRMLAPLGDLDFEDAVELFAKNVRVAAECGADLILIETMNDSYETKAAVLAAKENSNLPIFVTNVYDESAKLMTGASPEAMVALLEGLGVSAIGANCSLGPDKLLPVVKRLCSAASVPVIVKPNAGLPKIVDGESRFDITKTEFSSYMREIAECGASVLGGCCGTTPEYISETVEAVSAVPFEPACEKNICSFSSYTHAVAVGDVPILVGERINPTGKPKFKAALRENNLSYIIGEAVSEEEAGADALDVNVGLPEIDECEMMVRVVKELQAVTDLPLQIDSGNPDALERAMRIYNGKPLVNSVNGKAESLSSVLPLVKKYGGVLIALTMDESGIPSDKEGRIKIAEKILTEAEKYGIGKKNIIFDPLAMAVSSDESAALVTLGTVKELHARGCYTSLGVSNVSFGLPARDKINSTYFALALSAGLDMAIMNPHSRPMMDAYHAFCALTGKDEAFKRYIPYAEANADSAAQTAKAQNGADSHPDGLRHAIIKGIKSDIRALAEAELAKKDALAVINEDVVPALNEVGADFEAGRAYLPGLLMSAEAASAAFDVLKEKMPKGESDDSQKIILATVKGDIHDIGKNIVKVLLESYGFTVMDLGRDVPPEKILGEAKKHNIKLVGLSALMTTTVPAMEESVKLIHESLPDCRVMVGGAVLTETYAEKMGADFYAKDAMGAVKIAKKIFE